jgi:phosphoribosyl 1,2-cyclic phosphate phosphodiesterase
VTPFRLLHGRLPVLGFRLDPAVPGCDAPWLPLAYCTDVNAIPPETWPHLEGLSTLVLDALRRRKHPTHFTLGQAESVARHVGAERAYFVHMAHDLMHAEVEPELPDSVRLAYDGLTLE